GIGGGARARHVPPVIGPDIAAELDTGVAARDVVEPLAIECADLHVFDRLGLDGKIGSLCPSHRNETGCGAEEKTFRHLHLNLQVRVVGGSVSVVVTCTRWMVPFSPLNCLISVSPTRRNEPLTT